MRVLLASSAVGLGHASRDLVLARALEGIGWEVAFAAGPPAQAFLEDHGHRVLPLPPAPRLRVRRGRVVNWTAFALAYALRHRRAARLLAATLERHPWDLVVADEEFAAVDAARAAGRPYALVTDFLTFGARGPLAAPVARALDRALRRYIAAAPLVLVPDEGEARGNVRPVGPLVRPFSGTREALRARLGWRSPVLLATAGGTPAGAFLLDRVLELHAAGALGGLRPVVVGRPSRRAAPGGGLVLPYVRDLHDYILAADVVVALAGRSTVDEARAAGTPLVAIPLANHGEQEATAAALGFTPADLERLEEHIARAARAPRGAPRRGDPTRAARELARLVEGPT